MYGGRLRRLLPDAVIRCAAWLCLLLVLYPTIGAAAATTAVPVVTNIAGAVALRSPGGSSRDIFSSQLVHSGDLLMTGVDSLAVVNLADVGRVRLGPGTTATTASSGTNLTFAIAAGSMCAEAEHPAITIQSGALTVSAASDGTIFDLSKDASGTKLAVFQGQVTTQLNGKAATTLKTGQAVATTHDGTPAPVPLESIATTFAVLHCPDDSIVAQAMAPPGPTPAPSSGGSGGGGILGILLGIAGLAALAGHGGGGGGGGGGPQPNPSVLPSPSATPGALTVNPNSLSFAALGSATPRPSMRRKTTIPVRSAPRATIPPSRR